MSDPAQRPTPYDELLALPENVIGEILDGELVVSPRPGDPHTNASSVLGADLNSSFHRRPGGPGGPGGWWIMYEPELHLGPQVIVPDLAGWRRERMPRRPMTAAYTLAPDWVCEVISPGSTRRDRIQKKRIYAREQVTWVWLVDPLEKTLEVLRLGGEFYQEVGLYEGDEKVRAEPFEAVELDMARWWEEE